MSKNSQFTYGANPTVTMKRSKFNIGYDKLLSCNLGDLVPFYVEEVLPGDTFKITSKAISRVSSSFIKPAFANMYLDMYHFLFLRESSTIVLRKSLVIILMGIGAILLLPLFLQ